MKNELNFVILCIISIFFVNMEAKEIIYLCQPKNVGVGGFSYDFLKKISQTTKARVFVETGTYRGKTAKIASSIFDSVHTIELAKQFYDQAVPVLAGCKNVSVYLGSSANILSTILPKIEGKILFWLDAHFQGHDPKDKTEANFYPILHEIKAIKNSGNKNAIILIDDVRIFNGSFGWPKLDLLYNEIKSIDPLYNIEVYGDILFAYRQDEEFTVSPLVHACTISRFFEHGLYTEEEVLEAEKLISQANEQEKAAIKSINEALGGCTCKLCYLNLWAGLINLAEGNFENAFKLLSQAKEKGIKHERIDRYLKHAEFGINSDLKI